MLSIEEQNILPYNIYPNIYTYISEYSFQKSFYAYCLIHLWIIMIKCIIIGNFRGTCASVECWRVTYLSVEMLKWYMLICRNAEGVYGKRKVGNPCSWRTHLPLALYNYKLIHFSSHSSDYHGTRSSNYRRNNSNRNSLRNTCCFYVIACMKRFLSMPLLLMNRNGFIEKRHSARVSCSLSTICSLQLKCNTHNVTDHYTTSCNRNLYIAMYACAELYCVWTNVSNKFVFRRFPLRGGLAPSAPTACAPGWEELRHAAAALQHCQ